jgi:flagellar hook-associated protein 1
MLGLFGTLDLAQRSLAAQQEGLEVAGHNLANVSNPAYSRQRINIQTSPDLPTTIGPEGTGVQVVGIAQLRSALLDLQIQNETSIGSYLGAQQQALEDAQAGLGQEVSTESSSASSASASQASSGLTGLAAGLSDLFGAFQSLSTDPTSLAERQVVLMKAQSLAQQFNQTGQQLDTLRTSLSNSVESDATSINTLMTEIAKLNDQIVNAELGGAGVANDLRDTRQSDLESLAKLVKIDTANQSDGAVNISVGGVLMVSGKHVLDQVEAYDAGGGQVLVRSQNTGLTITPTSGDLAGNIDVRDGAVATLQSSLDSLASQLIAKVNTVHAAGYNLGGTNGADFFSGSDAGSMAVNTALLNDPSLVQASSTSSATGDNGVALALAQLANQSIAGLGNQTFSQSYDQTVAQLGQNLASTNSQVTNQQLVQNALSQQRSSVSGVSIDEEMTDLMKYQRAYEASAQLVSIVNSLLETTINMRSAS